MKKFGKLLIIFTLILCSSICIENIIVNATSNENIIYTTLRNSYGFSPAQATGILANIGAESSFNPDIYNKSKISYGLMQWTGKRKTALFDYCKSNGLNVASISSQLSFMYYEMTTTEKKAYNNIKSQPNTAQGAYNAGYNMCLLYERPAGGVTSATKRANKALNVYFPKYTSSTSKITNAVANVVTPKKSTTSYSIGIYTTTSSLNVRTGPSTSYKKLGTLTRGTKVSVTGLNGGWGKISYNKKVGYISLQYTSLNTSSSKVTSTVSKSTGKYKVTTSLNLRVGPATSYNTLGSVKSGTIVKVTSITNNWGKVTVNNKTGYISLKYATQL